MVAATLGLLGALGLSTALLAQAQPSISPVTWDVVGLDSNNLASGPNVFPVGVRVCAADSSLQGHAVRFVWESANANIERSSAEVINLPTVAAGACQDLFHEVTITRVAAARSTGRRYRMDLEDAGGTVVASTPVNREVFVRPLIRQNRNSTQQISLDGVAITPGGPPVALVAGQSYAIRLDARTATQGYEQLQQFLTLPSGVFQVNSVTSTYTANGGTDPEATSKIYADGCGWDNDLTSPTYQSCLGRGKYGGTTSVTYNVTALGAGQGALNALIYDFSGNSYHYNSDFESASVTFEVEEPPPAPTADLAVSKSDGQSSVAPGASTTYTIIVGNNGPDAVSGAQLEDIQPAGVTFSNWSCSVTTGTGACGTVSGSGNIDILVDLLPGAELTLTVEADYADPMPSASVVNTVSISVPAGTVDPNPGNNEATDVNATEPVADLGLTKVALNDAPAVGERVSFELIVSNSGPSAANGAQIIDTLPDGFSLSPSPTVTCEVLQVGGGGATACGSQAFAGSVMTAVADVDAGGQLRYLIEATVNGTGPDWLNTAEVNAPAGVTDPNLGNNIASAGAEPSILTITKTPDRQSYGPGETAIFTIRVNKQGNSAALGLVTVTDSPGPGLVLTGMEGVGWSCSISGGIGTCQRTDVAGFTGFYPDITVAAEFDLSGSLSLPSGFSNVAFVENADTTRFAEFVTQVSFFVDPARPVPGLALWAMLLLATLVMLLALRQFRW